MRLNQYLARAGFGSRRAVEELIREGSVTINGHRLRELAVKVKPEDNVLVNGKPVKQPINLVAALHKPAGYLCTSADSTHEKTIYDLLPKGWPRVVYVGRLDKDSEGLLIVTNDGLLSQRLTHPSSKLPKTYIVTLDREFDFAGAPKLLKGFPLEEGFAKMEDVFRVGARTLKVVLTQGLKRQIRSMFLRLGYEVKRLVRIQIGALKLDHLAPGEHRVLTKKEIEESFALAPGATKSMHRKKKVGSPKIGAKTKLDVKSSPKLNSPTRKLTAHTDGKTRKAPGSKTLSRPHDQSRARIASKKISR